MRSVDAFEGRSSFILLIFMERGTADGADSSRRLNRGSRGCRSTMKVGDHRISLAFFSNDSLPLEACIFEIQQQR